MQSLRLAQFDQFQRWHPRDYTPVPVRVVDIDEAALKEYGQWPWPRTRLAELVDGLTAAGAASIGFDVLLSEPDRTSPAAMAQLWHDPQATAVLARLPDHDAVFARSLAGRPVVLGQNLLPAGGAAPESPASAAQFRVVRRGGVDLQQWLTGFASAVGPLPAFAGSAAGVGALNTAPDADGVLRRVPLLLRLGTQVVPGLAAEALRVAQHQQNYLVQGNEAGVNEVRIGKFRAPTDPQAEMWLHYPADRPDLFVSAAVVLGGKLAPDQLRGQIVLVGSSAAGLMDLRFNPMGQRMAGVQAHALALEQLLSGQHLQRPPWAAGFEALILLLGTLAVALVALGAPVRWAALVLAALLALLGGGVWYAFVGHAILLDAVNPGLAMVLAFGLASGIHHWASERQQRWLRAAFSRYVSPNRVAHLVAHPEQLHLGGQRQVCSFVFTDLAGFTGMMEAGDPASVVALLNEYLEGMLQIAFRHEGTLDRIVGDAVAVLFSAPVAQPDHRQRALNCALEMDAFAASHATRLRAQGMPWGDTRIGVHSGEVIVGNFGGRTMFDYRALGDPINTAARLESVNKHLGTRVCVSAAVLDGCAGVAVRAVGRLVLKGKSLPLEVFAPIASLDATVCAPADPYDAAMRLLEPGAGRDAAAARERFEALARAYPGDPLVALHAGRLRKGAPDDLIVMADK